MFRTYASGVIYCKKCGEWRQPTQTRKDPVGRKLCIICGHRVRTRPLIGRNKHA